jgi:hypothetical protein
MIGRVGLLLSDWMEHRIRESVYTGLYVPRDREIDATHYTAIVVFGDRCYWRHDDVGIQPVLSPWLLTPLVTDCALITCKLH